MWCIDEWAASGYSDNTMSDMRERQITLNGKWAEMSNTVRTLTEDGWEQIYIEPDPAFERTTIKLTKMFEDPHDEAGKDF
jgi:hypothetical protein